ncbi:MAG: lycopene cyclase family protein [Arachnia sp.]
MSTSFDVAVVGLGPAGRTLAHRLSLSGLSVLGVDPHPHRAWPQTLGGWTRQIPGWVPDDAVALTVDRPHLRAAGDHVIDDQYAILGNTLLQQATPLTDVSLEEQVLDDDGVARLRNRASIVIDARGARPAGHPGAVPHQTAHGILVPPELAAPILDGANAVLMDWRPFDGAGSWGATPPTFLYVIPMPDGRVLLEETCLAGHPAPGQEELRRRLLIRLTGAGLGEWELNDREVERVSIPLVRQGSRIPGVWRFGAAGAQNNPFSGYTFFASLAVVDDWVTRIVGDDMPRSDQPLSVRRRALHGVLNLSPDDTFELFDAFGRLPTAQQRDVLDASTPMPRLVAAMTRQFMAMPLRPSIGLARATLLP